MLAFEIRAFSGQIWQLTEKKDFVFNYTARRLSSQWAAFLPCSILSICITKILVLFKKLSLTFVQPSFSLLLLHWAIFHCRQYQFFSLVSLVFKFLVENALFFCYCMIIFVSTAFGIVIQGHKKIFFGGRFLTKLCQLNLLFSGTHKSIWKSYIFSCMHSFCKILFVQHCKNPHKRQFVLVFF